MSHPIGARVEFIGGLCGIVGNLPAGAIGIVLRPINPFQCVVDWQGNPHATAQPWCYRCLKRLDDPKAMQQLADSVGWTLPQKAPA